MSLLRIKDISLRINERDILKNINLNVLQKDFIFILGHSGSGKSTLLRICASLVGQSDGEILLNDKSYSEYNPKELRKEIGYIAQEPCLFGERVRENFEFVYNIRNMKVDYDRINELLEKFNLSKDYLDKSIDSLSGGQKQRIAIIRGILVLPKVLLLDEITSALDEDNKLIVENIIKDLNESGVSIIWVTHDISQCERLNKKYIKIENGKTTKEAC
ncbi:ABC transporter ATP-binding protein [Romboutsia sp.]|uniref:ABC transporter ATP-binding protein n=1 Tax=Romboutsia sp. TaxID=1965302 RepID=UPI002B7EAE20|nr:ATP-binding cassette domain-containing protein [Romboutsia sp.]HSQ89938.1 ATP-binding cassette domain-containing protein [Romboutsia sp.]